MSSQTPCYIFNSLPTNLLREIFNRVTGFWNSDKRPKDNADHAVECWEYSVSHSLVMLNYDLSIKYLVNRPKHAWVKAKTPVRETEPERYQPLCCSLSGVTRETREAVTRLPEYILVGDPRRNIICRCVCHTSDIKECTDIVLVDKCKVLDEKPVVPVASIDEILPKKRRRNRSNNNSNEKKDKAGECHLKSHRDIVINPMVDAIMARYSLTLPLLFSVILICSAFILPLFI